MLGAIVGDLIGSPSEFANLKSTDFRLFAQGSQCTDDSVLTVATADALLSGDSYTTAYQNYFHRFPVPATAAASSSGRIGGRRRPTTRGATDRPCG